MNNEESIAFTNLIANDDVSDLTHDYIADDIERFDISEYSNEDMTYDMIDNDEFVDCSWFINITGADLMDALETVCTLAGKRIISIVLEDDE